VQGLREVQRGDLGVGDAWDVLSGVDYLIGKGMADPDRIAFLCPAFGGSRLCRFTRSPDSLSRALE